MRVRVRVRDRPQRPHLAAHAREEAQRAARDAARQQRVRRDKHARGGVARLDAVPAPRRLCVKRLCVQRLCAQGVCAQGVCVQGVCAQGVCVQGVHSAL